MSFWYMIARKDMAMKATDVLVAWALLVALAAFGAIMLGVYADRIG
jgi:MFS-type transporter involved in bile tolerance (Atg22 family)